MTPHTGIASAEQIATLLNFLDEHKNLALGALRSIEGKVRAKRLWEEICNTLNSMGGCTKSVQQWQKVWFDRKHLAKKAAAAARRSASATGGGPSTAPQLSELELKVLSIMGENFGGRQIEASSRAFEKNNEPSTSSQPTNLPQPAADSEEVIVEYSLLNDDASQSQGQSQSTSQSVTVTQEASNLRQSPQSTLSRESRNRAASGDARTRLFYYEAERGARESLGM